MTLKPNPHITGPADPTRPMWEMTLGEMLDITVARFPDKVFVEIAGERISYREFQERALRAAGMFQELGVKPGERAALLLPNVPEALYCWFGLAYLGAVAVFINTAYKAEETSFILNDAGARVIVAHTSLLAVAEEAARLAPGVSRKLAVGAAATANGWESFAAQFGAAEPLKARPAVQPSDLCMLVYTSGTTGNPKGVMCSHQMYAAAGQGFAYWTQATPADRFFTCLPYYHANAQYYSTMGALAVGGTLAVAERFSASRFWTQVREARATIVNFIGMILPVLAKQPPSAEDRDNPARLFYGSPAFAPEFLESFQQRFGIDIIVGFGMTETCFGTIERLGAPRRPNSCGQLRQHPDPRFVNEIRIVDDAGNPLPPRTPGEITIRNPVTMAGYWNNPEQTRQALRDGWLFTGDLAWLDEDGFLYFVDRKKDVIRRRGENVSSQQVEEVIKRHPKIMDCAIIAVPAELSEDEIKAYVTPRPGETLAPEEVIHWCAERLAYFKVPRYIELRDELPRTPSLRVRKDALRQERHNLTDGCFDREKAGIRLR